MPMGGNPWPEYILVREGDKVRAFAKYGAREALTLRGALDARTTAR
jgi:hypothetical protein